MEFRILGPVQIHDERTRLRVVPTGAKQRALLGALVVKAGQAVSADRLVDELWGEHPPANASNALQAHVARLRRLLPVPAPGAGEPHQEWLQTRPLGYALRLGRTGTDAQHFQRLAAQGRRLAAADPAGAVGVLRTALALWRGPALEGSGHGTLCSAEASLLEESRLAALETLYDACLRAGLSGEITGELEGLVTVHPLRERFYELLMTALYRCGRQAEALRTYDRARRRLVHDLGVGPGPALRGWKEAVAHRQDAGAQGAAEADRMPPAGHAWARDAGTGMARWPHEPVFLLPGAAPADAACKARHGSADGEAGVQPLCEEIARLRRQVERLSREQQDLISRLDRLDRGRAPGR